MLKSIRCFSAFVLCSCILFCGIYSSASDVSAAYSRTLVRSTDFALEFDGTLRYEYSNCSLPFDYETDGQGRTYAFWYEMISVGEIFRSSADYYGYEIAFTPTRNDNLYSPNSFVMSAQLVFGTREELYSGKGAFAYTWSFESGNRTSDSVWITTNHSAEEKICVGVLLKCKTYVGTSSSTLPELTLNEDFRAYVYGYSQTEYTNAINNELTTIKQSLNTQNNLSAEQKTILQNQSNTLNNQLEEAKKQTSEMEEQTENQKNFFDGFFDNLKNLIVGIFVPSSDSMQDIWSEFDDFFNNTFGFLYAPFDIVFRLFDVLMSDNSNTVLQFPSFEIMGHKIFDSASVRLDELEIVQTVFGYVRTVTGGVLAFYLINYLRNFFDKRFGGGGN